MTTNSLCAASKSHGHSPPLFAWSDGKLCICFRFFFQIQFSFHVSEFHLLFFPPSALFLRSRFFFFWVFFWSFWSQFTKHQHKLYHLILDQTLLNGTVCLFPNFGRTLDVPVLFEKWAGMVAMAGSTRLTRIVANSVTVQLPPLTLPYNTCRRRNPILQAVISPYNF